MRLAAQVSYRPAPSATASDPYFDPFVTVGAPLASWITWAAIRVLIGASGIWMILRIGSSILARSAWMHAAFPGACATPRSRKFWDSNPKCPDGR